MHPTLCSAAKSGRHGNPPISELPWDIMLIILSYIPVSLLKFKCVSSLWLACISSPDFSKEHLLVTQTRPRRIALGFAAKFFDHCCVSRVLSVSRLDPQRELYQHMSNYKPPYNKLYFVGSSDGLVCLRSNYEQGCLLLWNPAINKLRYLPHLSVDVQWIRSWNFGFGFGFDKASNDYKVIGLFHEIRSITVLVFSFRTSRWKRIKPPDIPRDHTIEPTDEPTAFANGIGKFYWVISRDYDGHIGIPFVCYLKVHTEVYEVFKIPEVIMDTPESYKLALSDQNLLHVLCNCRSKGIVWLMKEDEDGVSWTMLCIINYVAQDIDPKFSFATNFWVLNSGEILVLMGSTFVIYDTKDRSQRLSTIRSPVGLAACTFVDSLVWPEFN